jgi:hypothetical protein
MMGAVYFPETPVASYKPKSRNTTEELRPLLPKIITPFSPKQLAQAVNFLNCTGRRVARFSAGLQNILTGVPHGLRQSSR